MKRLAFILLATSLAVISGCAWTQQARDVASQELSPETLLERYEWFKDASAKLDKKKADISVLEAQIDDMKEAYGSNRSEWPKDARTELNQLNSEMFGIRASYNDLAADYNSAMAKINYRFTNVGKLPEGATETLPREYKPYEEGV